ncbi:MAG: Asp-tRNA(Asn)/Glu-tRNA(Gln) amidotransferase subunit GatC [Rickettsiales bacterium]|nr:Asp-tRNA(Asn)/Glu-tRNA(Gln) amidotransferase subunit GatC [Rickettsiales bacterium]
MTEINNKDVLKIAKLARIELTEGEVEKYSKDLSNIFHMIDELNEVNTDGVPEMAGVGGYTLRLRDNDIIADGNIREAVIANAPKSQFGCFVVPKVVDNG